MKRNNQIREKYKKVGFMTNLTARLRPPEHDPRKVDLGKVVGMFALGTGIALSPTAYNMINPPEVHSEERNYLTEAAILAGRFANFLKALKKYERVDYIVFCGSDGSYYRAAVIDGNLLTRGNGFKAVDVGSNGYLEGSGDILDVPTEKPLSPEDKNEVYLEFLKELTGLFEEEITFYESIEKEGRLNI